MGYSGILFEVEYPTEAAEFIPRDPSKPGDRAVLGDLLTNPLIKVTPSSGSIRAGLVTHKSAGHSGRLISLPLRVRQDASPGGYLLRLLHAEVMDIHGNWPVGMMDGLLVVRSSLPGDIDNDSRVTVQDATYSLRLASEWTVSPPTWTLDNADINKDGRLNLQDTTSILRKAVGLIPYSAPRESKSPQRRSH
jgi:hypothetical protein